VTPRIVKQITLLLRSGHSVSDITEKLSHSGNEVTRNNVYYIMRREKIKPVKEPIIYMQSMTETAKRAGVSRSTVYRHKGSIYAQTAQMMHQKGQSLETIALELKVSMAKVKEYLCLSEC
jgi:DNA-binding CsgD family transcriptional regulator